MGYVYRMEKVARLLGMTDRVLRMERQFGPPHDYPHKMVETVRKQLPTQRAAYKLECLRQPPRNVVTDGQVRALLRIPERNALFAELMRVPDERAPSVALVYFGVDDAASPTSRTSPNLYVPFEKIDVLVADKWLALTPAVLAVLARDGRRFYELLTADAQLMGRAA